MYRIDTSDKLKDIARSMAGIKGMERTIQTMKDSLQNKMPQRTPSVYEAKIPELYQAD